MLVNFRRYLVWITLLGAFFHSVAFANSWSDHAMELAAENKFDQALSVLAAEPINVQQSYDHRFLKARILSWDGQYEKAEMELNALDRDFPNNADVILTKGNLEYYQGNLKQAERNFLRVLELAPNYADAKTGLENVRRAKAAKKSWRVDGGTTFSSFDDDDIQSWDDQNLRVEYRTDDLAYSVSGQRYNRFGQTDVQLVAGLADAQRGGLDWGLIAGVTPSASFRPDVSAGVNLGYSIDTPGGTTFYPRSNYRYDQYDTGDVHTVQTGVDTYLENGLVLSADIIGTFQETGGNDIGFRLSGRYPITDQFEIRAGYANAPETINGVAIDTETFFGGISYAVTPDLKLHLNLSNNDREDSFSRDDINVGFTREF